MFLYFFISSRVVFAHFVAMETDEDITYNLLNILVACCSE